MGGIKQVVNRIFKTRWIALPLAIIALTGCSLFSLNPMPELPLPTTTLTPTVSQSKFTPTNTDIEPIMSPSATPSPNQATTKTIQPKLTGTPQLKSAAPTAVLPPLIATDKPYIEEWHQSPTGSWYVELRLTPPSNYLLFISQDRKVRWSVDLATSNSSDNDYEMEGWSNNENYAFFMYKPFRPADGPGPHYFECGWLKRIDLRNGSITSVVDFGVEKPCWNFRFSPDMTWLAYIQSGSPLSLVLLKLNTGQKLSYPIEQVFWGAGEITWALNSKELLFDASQGENDKDLKSSVFLARLENERLDAEKIVSQSGYVWHERIGWKGDQVLIYHQQNIEDRQGEYFLINPATKKTIQVTLTPTPGE